MPPIIKLIQAIARLTQAGAIKKVEDAYKLAKRELGERFDEYKEIVKDAFNEGKRKQTIDKRTKDIKKDEEDILRSYYKNYELLKKTLQKDEDVNIIYQNILQMYRN